MTNYVQDTGEQYFAQVMLRLGKNIKKAAKQLDMEDDTDFIVNEVETISVKTYYNHHKYRTLPFEVELYNDTVSTAGSFARCKARWYAMVLPQPGDVHILLAPTQAIKDLVKTRNYRVSNTLSAKAQDTNVGRYYTNAKNVLVNKQDLYSVATTILHGNQLPVKIPPKLQVNYV